MKNTKRVLLSLLAAVMLFGCFGVMASADGDYITYTVKGGDTALGICEGLKIDFFANQAWISEVNGIGSYNNIKVNQVLYLPTFDTSKDLARANRVKEEIKKASAAAKPAVVTSAAPAAVGTTTMGDSVVSYLVNYKLQPGDNLFIRFVNIVDERSAAILNGENNRTSVSSDASIYLLNMLS